MVKEILNGEFDTIISDLEELKGKIKDKHDLRMYSERLCSLGSTMLNLRYGTTFNGIYPFCGLDVLTPYLLGGNWLLIDESWSDYQTEISKYEIPNFENISLSDRIRIIEKPIESTREEVSNFNPQIVLIKYSGTEGNYEKIFDFLTHIMNDSHLLIIACVSRQLEKYIDNSSAYQLSLVKIGSKEEISLPRQIQPDYQTFFFLDRLKLYELIKKE